MFWAYLLFLQSSKKKGVPGDGLSKRERRENFKEMNQPLETLLGKGNSGKARKIEISLPYKKGGETPITFGVYRSAVKAAIVDG